MPRPTLSSQAAIPDITRHHIINMQEQFGYNVGGRSKLRS